MSPASAAGSATPPSALRSLLELLALSGLAITQPVLDLFGRAPQQFAFRGVGGWGIVVFAVAVAAVPALGLWAIERVVTRIHPTSGAVIHLGAVGVLVAAVVSQTMAGAGSPWLQALVAVAAGTAAVVAYVRWAMVRSWLAVMALAPVAFVLLFVVASPTSKLLGATDAVAVAAGIDNPVPVVVVVFDELPLASLVASDGTIDGELFPNFAALADTSHWFTNTTTVSGSTWHAVPALTSGKAVSPGTAPVAVDHPETLFTLLGDGYRMNVTESVTSLCPPSVCTATQTIPGGLTTLFDDAWVVWRQRVVPGSITGDPVAAFVEPEVDPTPDDPAIDDRTDTGTARNGFADFELSQPARVVSFTDNIGGTDAALHYLHILLPHVPLRFLPDGRTYDHPNPDLGRIDDQWADDAWLTDLARQRHLLQVAYTDALVGELVANLKATGVWDEALVIITADHGIAFEPGGAIRGLDAQDLTAAELADTAWVPLFVKEPGQTTPTVSDANVLTLDVVPTVLDVIGLNAPWNLDGQSVFTPRTDTAKPFWPSEVTPFGVMALEPIDLSSRVTSTDVLARGPHLLLGPPSATSVPRWWTPGPAQDLVGTQVGDAPPGLVEAVEAEVLGRGALVWGRSQEVSPGEPVAIAIDGTVVATAVAHNEGDRAGWAAMVGPAGDVAPEANITVWRIRR